MLTNGNSAEPKATSSVVRTSFTGERPVSAGPEPSKLPGGALGMGSPRRSRLTRE